MFGEGLDLLRREKLSVVQKIGKIIELFSMMFILLIKKVYILGDLM